MTCRPSTDRPRPNVAHREREPLSRITTRYRIATLPGKSLRLTGDIHQDFLRKRRRRGRRGSRTAISVGVLAVALMAVPVGAPAASAAAQDCTRAGGLLGGVTNTLCDVVGALTGTVDTLTGGATGPVTDGVDKTTDEVLGRVGEAVPTTRPTTARPPTSSPPTRLDTPRPVKTGVRPEATGGVCSPEQACTNQEDVDKLSPRPTPKPTRTKRTHKDEDQAATIVTRSPTMSASARPHPTHHESRPQPVDTGQAPAGKKTARAEEPRVDLLWPNPFAHELAVPMQDQRV